MRSDTIGSPCTQDLSSSGVRASGSFGVVFLDDRFLTAAAAARAGWGREPEMMVRVMERLDKLSRECFLVLLQLSLSPSLSSRDGE